MGVKIQLPDDLKAELEPHYRALASTKSEEFQPAAEFMAQALKTPLRQGIAWGDITGDIFEEVDFPYGVAVEFPLDLYAPGSEKEFIAFTIPTQGGLPQSMVQGDYVTLPTYEVANVINCRQQYARDARWDILGRMLQILEAGHIKKNNDDAWHSLIAAGVDRNVVVYDSNANSGQFTKRVVSLAKTIMRRNGGGNSTSISRARLTDLFLSPELVEDMRNWGVDIVDEFTRKEIYDAADRGPSVSRVFGVNLHDIDEFGEGQEYQNYYTTELGASLPTGDLEMMVGLDLSETNNDSFIRPVKQRLEVKINTTQEAMRILGYQSYADGGWGIFDNRRVIVLSA